MKKQFLTIATLAFGALVLITNCKKKEDSPAPATTTTTGGTTSGTTSGTTTSGTTTTGTTTSGTTTAGTTTSGTTTSGTTTAGTTTSGTTTSGTTTSGTTTAGSTTSSTTSGSTTISTGGTGNFSVDGTAYTVNSVIASKSGTTIILIMSASNASALPAITLYLNNVNATGTYTNASSILNYGTLVYSISESYSSFGGAYSFTISSYSATRIIGTFTYTAKLQTGTATKTVTGSFDTAY